MEKEVFSSELSKFTLTLYLGLALILLGISTFTFIEGKILSSIVLLVVALVCMGLLLLSYGIRYELTDHKLRAKWIFGTKELDYREIKGFQSYKLPLTSLRRFGISMLGGRYSHGDVGKFYAIFSSRRGVLIEATESSIYGGKLFISPQKSEEFLEELKIRADSFTEK